MQRVPAKKVIITKDVEKDSLSMARAERLMTGIDAEEVVRGVDDAALCRIIQADGLDKGCARHGVKGKVESTIFFVKGRFTAAEEEKAKRKEQYPPLFANSGYRFHGYGGFDWRDSGSQKYRETTGLVCQPAYQLHTIFGCPFRCAYCSMGRIICMKVNLEEFVGHFDEWMKVDPNQTLYQFDNGTDVACFEPEYGAAKLFVEYFAKRKTQYLELYVGKSDNVDYLLDLDHRGHTVPCWSVSCQTQSTVIERGTAPMRKRIDAARKCQLAGYPVRIRFSPMVPVRNWRQENREMIEYLFSQINPDVITFESIRFMNHDQMIKDFGEENLAPEFVEQMRRAKADEKSRGCEVPDVYRVKMYEFIVNEIERISPRTPYAFCREKRDVWDIFQDDFVRHGQNPDKYLCNCGGLCTPTVLQAPALSA
ncbi:MAG: spore photoproduct lyase family protein [Planctomycetota bacterium]